MLSAARVLLGVAVVKIAWMALAVALGNPAAPTDVDGLAFGLAPTVALAAAFVAAGAGLIWASPGDTRGWWLGGTLLLVGTAFSDGVLSRRTWSGVEGWLSPAVPVDALLPWFLWSFLRDFPHLMPPAPDCLATWFVRVSAVVGLVLVAANVAMPFLPAAAGEALAASLMRTRASTAYWPLVIGLTAAAVPYLVWKSHRAETSEAWRVRIFAAGIAVAAGPILLDILLAGISPAYEGFSGRPEARSIRVLVLFSTLALVPLVTAYSVLVDRVIDVRIVLRTAVQYALARYTLLIVVSAPFVLLALYLVQHRQEPLARLFTGPQVIVSLALAAAGAAALHRRSRWLQALDRRFFRDESDAAALVASLADHARVAGDELELSRIVRRDVANGLQVEHAALLVSDSDGAAFRDPDARLAPLGHASGLALLLSGDTTPFDVRPRPDNPVLARLPVAERRWLADSGFELLVPIRRSRHTLAAVLGLGPKRSGQPFSASDRRVLAAVAASVTLALENQRLRSSPSGEDEEAAEECLTCGAVHPSGTTACSCGSGLARAPVPHLLRHAFRFERRLGAGGMGVVYRAWDLALARPVAIKTLPRLSASRAERLRLEAQTMARLAHPNLATIHGAETWRGTPLLVVELLGGGTLADRLHRGPLPLPEVLDLGLALSDVLAHVHREDMVHCDIKPSNIGFTAGGTLKLLDFGLARMLADAAAATEGSRDEWVTALASTHTPSALSRSHAHAGRFVGTPLYMAPEAIEGRAPSPLFDLWGTAVVLYEAVAGHHPFAGGATADVLWRIVRGQYVGFAALAARLPAGWSTFFERTLAEDPARRPASALDLKAWLLGLRAHAASR